MAIITVQNLKKRYGDIEAVKNISFEIEEGEQDVQTQRGMMESPARGLPED